MKQSKIMSAEASLGISIVIFPDINEIAGVRGGCRI
jgi:hypothetical protein